MIELRRLLPLLVVVLMGCGDGRPNAFESRDRADTGDGKRTSDKDAANLVQADGNDSNPIKSSSQIDVRQRHVAGGALRLIVETSRRIRPLLSHSSKTLDAKGYYVTIDLSSKDGNVTTYGPLWDIPNVRSSISFNTGANFTEADRTAAAAQPKFIFDANGSLNRFVFNLKNKKLVRDTLKTFAQHGQWEDKTEVSTFADDLPPFSEMRLFNHSGTFIILHENGVSKLFDRMTGQEKKDEWLTDVFTQKCQMKDFQNVGLFLTDDLNHLVASPRGAWNKGNGEAHITTFELDGKVYSREKYGIYYSRPSVKPMVFLRHENERSFLDEAPYDAFSIDGELHFYMAYTDSIKLYKPSGEEKVSINVDLSSEFGGSPKLDIQHSQNTNELILFEDVLDFDKGEIDFRLIRWNYKENRITRHELKVEKILKEQLTIQPIY